MAAVPGWTTCGTTHTSWTDTGFIPGNRKGCIGVSQKTVGACGVYQNHIKNQAQELIRHAIEEKKKVTPSTGPHTKMDI